MYFGTKSTLKSYRNRTSKRAGPSDSPAHVVFFSWGGWLLTCAGGIEGTLLAWQNVSRLDF